LESSAGKRGGDGSSQLVVVQGAVKNKNKQRIESMKGAREEGEKEDTHS